MNASIHTVTPADNTVAAQQGVTPLALLQFEAEIRDQESDLELLYHMANESRRLLNFDQAFIFKRLGAAKEMRVSTISSLAVIDRNVPAIQWAEHLVGALGEDVDLGKSHEFKSPAYTDSHNPEYEEYPFKYMLWIPMKKRDGTCFAGLLVARTSAWPEAERVVAERLTGTYSHAWQAFAPRWINRRKPKLTQLQKRMAILALIALALLPVRLSVLAPAKIVAERPFILAAPANGVVKRIHVPPNTPVKQGQLIVSMEDILLRNDAAIAVERLHVAAARHTRATSAAFSDRDVARDIAITKAELHLAEAEANYAQGLLERAQLLAPQDGIAVYSDRRDWEGRPVAVGEHIVEIADPDRIEITIELPPKDLIKINLDAKVTVYLDSAPLKAVDAKVTRSSYHPSRLSDGREVFLIAALPTNSINDAHIGARGTARVYGGWAPLIYRVLRRPIAAARQAIGL